MANKTIGDLSNVQLLEIKSKLGLMKASLTTEWPDLDVITMPDDAKDAFETLRANQLKLTKGIEIVFNDLRKIRKSLNE